MHGEQQLTDRAKDIIETTRGALELPDSEQVFHDYHANIGPEYFMELRSHLTDANGRDGDEMRQTRYIYINGPHETGQCRPTISLDLNALVREGEVSGLVDGYDELLIAAEAEVGIDQEQVQLLALLYELLHQHNAAEAVNRDTVDQLHQSFIALLDRGSITSLRQLGMRHDDGAWLGLQSCTSTGSLEHVKQPLSDSDQLTVAVHPKGEKYRTVLAVNRSGRLESWTDLANGMERAALFADPENVRRDNTGRIIGIFGAGLDVKERVAVEAERAAGLRKLEVGRVALIGTYVDQLLRPLTNRGE